MENEKEDELNLSEYIHDRFAGARFRISCFCTIDEIGTKEVTTDPIIIVRDVFNRTVRYKTTNKYRGGLNAHDYYIVKRKIDQTHIYYKDVIDALIENNFFRDDVNFCFLKRVRKVNESKRNSDSIKIFNLDWEL